MLKGNESKENYLETILILKKQLGNVRSIDVARKMGYSKPSISKAMSILKSENLIVIDENGFINFTEAGDEFANNVYKKHIAVKTLLMKLGVSEEVASEDACRIEHCISDETFNKIENFVNN